MQELMSEDTGCANGQMELSTCSNRFGDDIELKEISSLNEQYTVTLKIKIQELHEMVNKMESIDEDVDWRNVYNELRRYAEELIAAESFRPLLEMAREVLLAKRKISEERNTKWRKIADQLQTRVKLWLERRECFLKNKTEQIKSLYEEVSSIKNEISSSERKKEMLISEIVKIQRIYQERFLYLEQCKNEKNRLVQNRNSQKEELSARKKGAKEKLNAVESQINELCPRLAAHQSMIDEVKEMKNKFEETRKNTKEKEDMASKLQEKISRIKQDEEELKTKHNVKLSSAAEQAQLIEENISKYIDQTNEHRKSIEAMKHQIAFRDANIAEKEKCIAEIEKRLDTESKNLDSLLLLQRMDQDDSDEESLDQMIASKKQLLIQLKKAKKDTNKRSPKLSIIGKQTQENPKSMQNSPIPADPIELELIEVGLKNPIENDFHKPTSIGTSSAKVSSHLRSSTPVEKKRSKKGKEDN